MQNVDVDFQEIVRQMKDYQRRIVFPIVVLLTVAVLSMGLFALSIEFFDLRTDPPGEMTFKRSLALAIWFVGTMTALFICCLFVPSPPKFRCPLCHNELDDHHDKTTMLTTGYCPKCLQPLFSTKGMSSVPSNDRSPLLLTRTDFQQQRLHIRLFNPLVPSFVGLVATIGGFIVATSLDAHRMNFDDGNWFPFYQFSVAIAGGAFTIGYIAFRSRARLAKLIQSRCTECHAALDETPMTLITGNCTRCGAQVLRDPSPLPSWPICARPWSRSWFGNHGWLWQKWGWIPCVTGALPAFAWMATIYWFFPPPNPANVNAGRALLISFALVVQAVATFLTHHWLRSCLGLKCPQCNESLVDVPPFVAASRNCPCCQTTILFD